MIGVLVCEDGWIASGVPGQEMLEIRHQLIGKAVGNHRDPELENKMRETRCG